MGKMITVEVRHQIGELPARGTIFDISAADERKYRGYVVRVAVPQSRVIDTVEVTDSESGTGTEPDGSEGDFSDS